MDQQVTELTKVCQLILKIDERANTYADVIPHWDQLIEEGGMNLRRIVQTVVDSAWLACLYFGLFQGVVGALNVALFATWAICVMSLFFKKEVAKAVGRKPAAVMAWSTGFDIAAILMLAWSGWFWTAACLTCAVIIIVGSWSQERAVSESAA